MSPLAVGDVFLIPLDDERCGAGQIDGKYGDDAYYFALYGRVYPNADRPTASAAVDDEVVILGLSMDARLFDASLRGLAMDLAAPRRRGARRLRVATSSLERVTGVEPASPAWKAGALPFSYTRVHGWNVVGGT